MAAKSRPVAALFIGANALTAGSIFCFPLFGPKMAADLGLSLLQTNAIWSAAVIGQYASAALIGSLSDAYGPRPVSLLASVLFGAGYLLMARTEKKAIVQNTDKQTAFVSMVLYFVLVGTGVAASLFSALRSSTAHFKSHPGLALSIPLTLFSLSSLFLSAFASLPFFTDPVSGDLNAPRWLASLGASLMVVNAVSAAGFSLPEEVEQRPVDQTLTSEHSEHSEASPLLPQSAASSHLPALKFSTPVGLQSSTFCRAPRLSLGQFLLSPAAWILAFILFAAVGGSEMVMSSIGSMVVSLKSDTLQLGSLQSEEDNVQLGREILALRTRQVQLIAIANTVARLLVGFISDLLAPNAQRQSEQNHSPSTWRVKIYHASISRLSVLLGGLFLLLCVFIFSATKLSSVDQLWIVSVATGAAYGLIFTLVPSIIICVWPSQFGRNYGILTYAAALGSLCFSMLFASVNDQAASHHRILAISPPDAICTLGRACFELSFAYASIAVFASILFTVPLWQAWHHSL